MRILIAIAVPVIIAIIVASQALFSVDERQYAVVTRFGEIGQVYTQPGLKVKAPFVDVVNYLDKRILRVDITPATIPDVEAQFLEIDAYVRYQIVDPATFFIRLRTELGAESRLSNIVVAALRGEIGQRTRVEIIGGQISIGPDGLPIVDPLLTPENIPSRAVITRNVLERSTLAVRSQDLGLQLVDIRIKRADFPREIAQSVFQRMVTEREIQAQRLRAEGEEEYLTRTADVNRRVEVIRAEAQEQSDRLRGEGQGEAIRILGEALNANPELFSFLRSLEAYETFINDNTTVVLSADSELFRFLNNPNDRRAVPEIVPPPAMAPPPENATAPEEEPSQEPAAP